MNLKKARTCTGSPLHATIICNCLYAWIQGLKLPNSVGIRNFRFVKIGKFKTFSFYKIIIIDIIIIIIFVIIINFIIYVLSLWLLLIAIFSLFLFSEPFFLMTFFYFKCKYNHFSSTMKINNLRIRWIFPFSAFWIFKNCTTILFSYRTVIIIIISL